jgi:protein gp37
MGAKTEIQWTDHTFNPWWGCLEVSPGCDHCYARTLAERWGFDVWGPPRTASRRLFGDKHWSEPLKWNAAAAEEGRRHRVFCASMADVFEFHPQLDAVRARLWTLIEQTPWLDWQLLTKRPMNIARMLPLAWLEQPRPNVWLGTSVEDQPRAALRILHLVAVPTVVHFLSCEPLLGPVDLAPWLGELDWIITGGESGPRHRPMDFEWVRDLRDQCQGAGVALFHKQHGGRTPKAGGRELDGRTWDEFPSLLAMMTA